MQIEYEATFPDVDKERIREVLRSVGAELKKSEFMQRRTVFSLPAGTEVAGGWVRVRDEGDQITMSVKVVDGGNIENQRESCVVVDSYQEAETLLQTLGCVRKAYQETKRELWLLDGVEITIDTWPFLESFVEVEGASEVAVKAVSEKLGFDWATARFCAVDALYAEKYGISTDRINNHTPLITFDMENPFVL